MSITQNHANTDELVDHPASEEALAAFSDKFFADVLGTLTTFAAGIGVELGWYEALAGTESMNATELAMTTSTDARYAREWLEHQAVSGYLQVADTDTDTDANDRRYSISAAAAEILTDRASLAYMAPFPGLVASLGRSLPELTADERVPECWRSPDRQRERPGTSGSSLTNIGPPRWVGLPMRCRRDCQTSCTNRLTDPSAHRLDSDGSQA